MGYPDTLHRKRNAQASTTIRWRTAYGLWPWVEKIISLPDLMKPPKEAGCSTVYLEPVNCTASNHTAGLKIHCKKYLLIRSTKSRTCYHTTLGNKNHFLKTNPSQNTSEQYVLGHWDTILPAFSNSSIAANISCSLRCRERLSGDPELCSIN